MEEILHQLLGSLSHYLQGFIHPRWWRISSINSSGVEVGSAKKLKTSETSWRYYKRNGTHAWKLVRSCIRNASNHRLSQHRITSRPHGISLWKYCEQCLKENWMTFHFNHESCMPQWPQAMPSRAGPWWLTFSHHWCKPRFRADLRARVEGAIPARILCVSIICFSWVMSWWDLNRSLHMLVHSTVC